MFLQFQRADKVSDKAIEICRNKHLAKQYLKKAGVPTPEGELFHRNLLKRKLSIMQKN